MSIQISCISNVTFEELSSFMNSLNMLIQGFFLIKSFVTIITFELASFLHELIRYVYLDDLFFKKKLHRKCYIWSSFFLHELILHAHAGVLFAKNLHHNYCFFPLWTDSMCAFRHSLCFVRLFPKKRAHKVSSQLQRK